MQQNSRIHNLASAIGARPANHNYNPGFQMGPTRGSQSLLGRYENWQQAAPWAGRGLGTLTGIPGLSTVLGQLGGRFANSQMGALNQNHYFDSPAVNNINRTNTMNELMANVDPNNTARGNSNQGVAMGNVGGSPGMYDGVGGSQGYRRAGTGGGGSGLGGGWRGIYQRPDEPDEPPPPKEQRR